MVHTLLLADDSVTIQRVIELTFADEDIRVVTVGDGQQAIDRIESERPDIVLADVGMPNRDGYEVAKHVKCTSHLSHIPVLLLTGAFEPVDEARATAAGCDGVLAKPFEPQMVINRVKELLSARGQHHERRAVAPEPVRTLEAFVPPSASPGFEALEDLETSFGAEAFAVAARPAEKAASPASVPPPAGNTPALSLDDYFDRLDAAFGSSGTVAPALQSLDEDIEDPIPPVREPVRREPPIHEPPRAEPPKRKPEKQVEAPAIGVGAELPPSREALRRGPAVASAEAAAPPAGRPRSAPTDTPDAPPLASAFSTLLAAERAEAIPSSTRVPLRSLFPALSPSNDELIDQVARRVLDRLTDQQFVSDIVVRVTERVVREEIERLRATLRDRA